MSEWMNQQSTNIMAQLERFPRQVNASGSLASPTVEKALRGGEFSKESPTSPGGPISPLSEEDSCATPQKKSVLSIVKEKAKKLRHSLSKKKHDGYANDVTPTWAASIEDEEEEEEEEDSEYLGAPMYESELAPEAYKENARQHPRATPVIVDNHVLNNLGAMDRQSKTTTPHHHHHLATATSSVGSNKSTMSCNGAEKLTPTSTKGSDAGLCISSKMQGLTVSKPLDTQTPSLTSSAPSSRKSSLSVTTTAPQTHPAKTASKLPPVASKAPRFSSAPSTPRKSSPSASSTLNMKNATVDQTWDRGLSVREYFKNKLEPGEDEKALSHVISEAMSSPRTPGDAGVMEKVREAVTSLLRNDEPSRYSVRSPTSRISSQSPVPSSNVQQVDEEENHGRILQPN